MGSDDIDKVRSRVLSHMSDCWAELNCCQFPGVTIRFLKTAIILFEKTTESGQNSKELPFCVRNTNAIQNNYSPIQRDC